MTCQAVDENLFYKGVDKSKVHGARLHQHHTESLNNHSSREAIEDADQPPYPFDTGQLLASTKNHNVRLVLPCTVAICNQIL